MRRASAEAADKAAMELSSSFAQKVPKLPHIKKNGRIYPELIFLRLFCVFFCVPTLENEHHPLPEKDISSSKCQKTSIWLIEIIGAKRTRLCGRGRGSRGSAEGSQGTWDMTSKSPYFDSKIWIWLFDVFLSLTPKNSSWIKGKNCHEIQQVMVLIHSVDLGEFRTSEDIPFHG